MKIQINNDSSVELKDNVLIVKNCFCTSRATLDKNIAIELIKALKKEFDISVFDSVKIGGKK